MRVTALATPGHTFTHLSYALTDAGDAADGSTARRRLLRRLAAVRRHRAPRPARRRAHRRPGPPPARLGPPARRPAPRRRRGLPDPRLRVVLLRHPVRGHRRRPSGRRSGPTRCSPRTRRPTSASCSPASAPGRPTTRTWPRPTRPARPSPTSARRRSPTPPSCAGGSRPASGSSTCATAPRSPPGTPAARSTSASTARFATYLGWLITWGTPVTLLGETAEDVAEAQRELVRIGIDRPAAHATGTPEDWTRRRAGHASRPPRSPTSPRSATTARSSSSTSAAPTSTPPRAIDGAVNIPLHELLGPARRGPGRRGVGALRRPATAPRSPPRCSTPPAARSVAVDDAFDNAEKVGLHLVGPEAA